MKYKKVNVPFAKQFKGNAITIVSFVVMLTLAQNSLEE